MIRRREFLRRSAATVAAVAAIKSPPGSNPQPKPHTSPQTRPGDKPPLFGISLAQYSLHRMLFAGELQTIDFPGFARRRFDIEAVEYVNTFFKDKAQDRAYLDTLRRRGADSGVKNLLIMVDGEGDLGDPDSGRRTEAIGRMKRALAEYRIVGVKTNIALHQRILRHSRFVTGDYATDTTEYFEAPAADSRSTCPLRGSSACT